MTVFEVVGAYYTDLFYNQLYTMARGRGEDYDQTVETFVMAMKEQRENYEALLRALHTYYTRWPSLASRYDLFVSEVVSAMVPKRHFESLSAHHREEILCVVLCALASKFAMQVTSPTILANITENRMVEGVAPQTVHSLQDFAMAELKRQYANISKRFMGAAIEAPGGESSSQVDALKSALRKVVLEKKQLQDALATAEGEAERLSSELKAHKIRSSKLVELVQVLRSAAERGPAAAGAELAVPPPCRIAEPRRKKGPGGATPARSELNQAGGHKASAAAVAPAQAAAVGAEEAKSDILSALALAEDGGAEEEEDDEDDEDDEGDEDDGDDGDAGANAGGTGMLSLLDGF